MDITETQQQGTSPQVLFTSRTKNFFRKGFKLGERLYCHPYVWDDFKGCPVFRTSWLRTLGWVTNILFTYGYFIFLVVQCVRISTSPKESASTKAFLLFTVILFFIPVFYQTTFLIAREELSNFVRGSFSCCNNFEQNYVQETARPSKTAVISGIFLTCLYYAMAVDAFLVTAYGLTRLNSPEQVSSMIPGGSFVQVPVNILFCSYFYATIASHIYVVSFSFMGGLFAFFDVMNELGTKPRNFTTARFQRPEDRIRTYRVLKLQADAIDRVFWVAILNGKYALMLLAMFCTYGAIRLDGLVGYVLGVLAVTACFFLVVYLGLCAEFFAGSSNALESLTAMTTRSDMMENPELRAWFRKSVKSLGLARIPVAGMYYIDKDLVLRVVGIISDGIVFLLVNF